MLERLEQCRTASLSGTATVRLNSHENNQIAWSEPSHPMKHQGSCSIVLDQQLVG